jgi:hypothetical protein
MRNSHQSKRGRTWITYEIVETVVICFISRIRCQRFCDMFHYSAVRIRL